MDKLRDKGPGEPVDFTITVGETVVPVNGDIREVVDYTVVIGETREEVIETIDGE